jgi:hypothetical protein
MYSTLGKLKRQKPPKKRICEGRPIVIYTGLSIEETKEGTHDDKVEGMEITALSTASVGCIGNMPDIIIGFCD